eukprot:2618399-Rhodomonas_salina.1
MRVLDIAYSAKSVTSKHVSGTICTENVVRCTGFRGVVSAHLSASQSGTPVRSKPLVSTGHRLALV